MAGLYLHIPFCTSACSYCDFFHVTGHTNYTSFVEALCLEVRYYADRYAHVEPIETLYLGGGTPSVLHLDFVERILNTIEAHYDTSAIVEQTFEINPEDMDVDYLCGLRALGIDRLNIGVQSFFDADLRMLNRGHSAEQAQDAVPTARQAGFENISVDLLFAVPEQPLEYWGANIQKVIHLEVPHVCTYGLTVEEHTPLYEQAVAGTVVPATEDTRAHRYRFAMDLLREQDYEHYEISCFTRPGYRSRHNQKYWDHSNVLAFGPSAHSFWREGLPQPGHYRWSNVRNLSRYQALLAGRQLPVEQKALMAMDELADEYIMLNLRTSDGVDLGRLEHYYGVDLLTEKLEELAWLESEGFIVPIRNDRVRLTDRGKLVCLAVTSKLVG